MIDQAPPGLAPGSCSGLSGPASLWVGLLSPYPADTHHSARADSIEANVENAEVHVERGTEQLHRASYYQVGGGTFCRKQPDINHLLDSSVAEKVTQEDVCSCWGVFCGSAHTGHHHLESEPVSLPEPSACVRTLKQTGTI